MAIAFSYTVSTNTVVVTGGTSGTPATFADFVSADRGDTALTTGVGASLKAAAVATTGMTLTYPVRPVEYKALRLTFTTAQAGGAAVSGDESITIYGTTGLWTTFSASEAAAQTVLSVTDASIFQVGDVVRLIDISAPATTETATVSAKSLTKGANTITVGAITNAFIAGDIVGVDQTEVIDTSAAHAAYITALPYGQIAYFDCAGYDGTNTVSVTQLIWGVIWNNGNGQYQCNSILQVGDGSTSTYFTQLADEAVYFSTGCTPSILTSATYQMGAAAGSYSGNGAFLKFPSQYLTPRFMYGGSFIAYGSLIHATNQPAVVGAGGQVFTFSLYDTIWVGNGTSALSGITQSGSGATVNLRNVYIYNIRVVFLQCTPAIMDDVWVHTGAGGFLAYGADVTVTGGLCTTVTNDYQAGGAGGNMDMIAVNPKSPIASPLITNAETNTVWEKYTLNLHVTDKDGANLAGVTVNLYGSVTTDYDTAAWTEGTVTTAADGTITQQAVTTRKWVGTSETLTNYNVFKMVLSKAGYETLSKENLTIAEPIDWHLELQDAIKLDLSGKRYEALPEQRLRAA